MQKKKKKNNKRNKRLSNQNKFYKLAIKVLIVTILLTTVGSFSVYFYLSNLELPKFSQLENIEPSLITKIYSRDSVLVKQLFQEKRNPVSINDVPTHLIQALLATEDTRFFDHWGFNTAATIRAAGLNVLKKLTFSGRKSHGASTITQQLARNLYKEIGFKNSIERKIKELLTSIQLENMYSKNEILEMYLTQSLFGPGVYGIQSGAKYYFGKDVTDLNIEESAILIGLLKAPNNYNPYRKPENAYKRREVVLKRMHLENYISREEYDSLRVLEFVLADKNDNNPDIGPYFTEHIRQKLSKLGKINKFDYLKDGLTVWTTMDSRIQKIAKAAIDSNMKNLVNATKYNFINDKKHGLKEYIEKNYDSTRWEFKLTDTLMIDSLTDAKLKPQVALLAIENNTGNILAMIGGTDFNITKLNRALQSWRQPGSIFKPIVYLTALDNGQSPATRLLNQPIVEINEDGSRWTPGNHNRKNITGLTTLREALRKSLNIVSIRLINELITPREVITYAKKLGMDTRYINAFSSIAIGTGNVRPLDIATAYSTIANEGTFVRPFTLSKIFDKNNQLIEEFIPEKRVGLGKETSYLITNMMQDVVNRGTGIRLRWKYGFAKGVVAGKTGTTDDSKDAWFCGFTPQITVVVWVGLDDEKYKLGEKAEGAKTALPIWGTFLEQVYKQLDEYDTSIEFTVPDKIIKMEICEESAKKAGPYCPSTYEEVFNKDFLDETICDIHTGIFNSNTDYRKNENKKDSKDDSEEEEKFFEDEDGL